MIYEISVRDGQRFTLYEETCLVNDSFCTFQVEWESWKKARETMSPKEAVDWMLRKESGERSTRRIFEKMYGMTPKSRQKVVILSSGSPQEALRPSQGWKASRICDFSSQDPDLSKPTSRKDRLIPLIKIVRLVMLFPSEETIDLSLRNATAQEVMST